MNIMQQIKQNWIGLLGLILLCSGLTLDQTLIIKDIINVIGILLLLIYAKQQNNSFFFYAEFVVLLGTVLKIISLNEMTLLICMSIASILALIKIFALPYYRTHFIETLIGLIGLFGLAFGFSTNENIGLVIGGLFLAIYGFIGFKNGIASALIFAILNLIFGGLALYLMF